MFLEEYTLTLAIISLLSPQCNLDDGFSFRGSCFSFHFSVNENARTICSKREALHWPSLPLYPSLPGHPLPACLLALSLSSHPTISPLPGFPIPAIPPPLH